VTIKVPDLASPRFKANPHPFYARLRSEAPVLRTRMALWLPKMWLITRYDDVLSVIKDPERFSNVYLTKIPWTPRWMRPYYQHILVLDPPDHTRLRALVGKAFTPRLVAELRGRIETLCDALLDAGPAKGQMDLVRDYALPIPMTIIADLLGIPRGERRKFAGWTNRLAASTSGTLTDMLKMLPSAWQFLRYFRTLIEKHRTTNSDDLLSALIRAEEAGDKLNEEELLGMVMLLLVAGYETTVNLIATGTLVLLENPKQRQLFVSSPDLVESAIEELLRYTSPADFASPRVAREDVTIGGANIRAGDIVLLVLGSANRDASRFADPDTLDLAREPNKHLAFGTGVHFCVGAPLARLEGEIALTKLFTRFPNLRLAAPAASLRWRRGLAFRGLRRLPVMT
jgi:cytochrome P450